MSKRQENAVSFALLIGTSSKPMCYPRPTCHTSSATHRRMRVELYPRAVIGRKPTISLPAVDRLQAAATAPLEEKRLMGR
jgi:hypothetical protein